MGGSAYGIGAVGDQTIISKVLRRQSSTSGTPASSERGANPAQNTNRIFESLAETKVPASAASDHGVSTWFGVSPNSAVDFQIGYSRSMHYDFNTLSFGVGFRVGK